MKTRQVFLDALAATGDVTAAAKRAGVTRQTPYKWRGKSPEFAARWDTILATRGSGDAPSEPPPTDSASRAPAPEPLPKLPPIPLQLAPDARPWEETFLRHLALTADVTLSARMAGIARSAVYDRREQSEPFRVAWNDAEGQALDRIERAAFDGARAGNDRLIRYTLGRRRPEKWGRYRESGQAQDMPERWPTITVVAGDAPGEQPAEDRDADAS